MESKKTSLIGIDVLKIIAIVWICLYHFLDFRNNWTLGLLFGSGNHFSSFAKNLIVIGPIGVNIFIIASGLGLGLSMNRNKLNYIQFLKKRVLKIFPFYWCVLSSLLILDLILQAPINFKDYLLHFFAIHTFFQQYTLSISAPFWFIGSILQLYLIFPLLFKISKKISPFTLLLIAIFTKMIIDPSLVNFFHGGRYFTEFLMDFCFGIILSNILTKKSDALDSKKFLLLSIPLIVSIYLVTFKSIYGTAFGAFAPLIYQTCAALFFLVILNLSNYLPGKFHATIKYLSTLTFIVFLTHYLLITKILTRIHFQLPFTLESIILIIASFSFAMLIRKSPLKRLM